METQTETTASNATAPIPPSYHAKVFAARARRDATLPSKTMPPSLLPPPAPERDVGQVRAEVMARHGNSPELIGMLQTLSCVHGHSVALVAIPRFDVRASDLEWLAVDNEAFLIEDAADLFMDPAGPRAEIDRRYGVINREMVELAQLRARADIMGRRDHARRARWTALEKHEPAVAAALKLAAQHPVGTPIGDFAYAFLDAVCSAPPDLTGELDELLTRLTRGRLSEDSQRNDELQRDLDLVIPDMPPKASAS